MVALKKMRDYEGWTTKHRLAWQGMVKPRDLTIYNCYKR